mgnify:CR=1 FL=1
MADQSPAVMVQKTRADKAWQQNAAWDPLYQDAHDYVIPFRKTGGPGTSKGMADVMFDMIGPNSAMHLAGQLHRILFGQPPQLAAGAGAPPGKEGRPIHARADAQARLRQSCGTAEAKSEQTAGAEAYLRCSVSIAPPHRIGRGLPTRRSLLGYRPHNG